MIGVIDYGAGNIRSVLNAVSAAGGKAELVSDASRISSYEKLILPGVGNFGKVAENLEKKGMDKAIKEFIAGEKPFLGICLGLQLLLEGSEESKGSKGFGLFKGKNLRFAGELKVPQIGWNQIEMQGKASRLFKGVKSGSFAYFVHSYYAKPEDETIVAAETEYGIKYASAFEKGTVFATQFHPEKSGEVGLRILKNFVEL
ncbi:MAG: imidazole glycerol phosphate synthase subunit HisH [Candidatus Diapherotrites archaeon]